MATEKNFQATDPAAPSDARNVVWQVDPTSAGTDATTGQPYFNTSAYIPDMVGDTGSGGEDGLVPAPGAGDAAAGKFLDASGAWSVPSGGPSGATISGVQQEAYVYAADTGTANAYAVALSPSPTIVAGSLVVFKATHANTGASTLAVNGAGAVAIRKDGAIPLVAGDISAGQIVSCVFDGTFYQTIGLAPTLVFTPVIRGSSSAGTGAGTANNLTVPLPTGSQSGDLALLFATAAFNITAVSGWTTIVLDNGFVWDMYAAWKILNSTDISTGSVNYTAAGSFDMAATMVTFIGPTAGIREFQDATTLSMYSLTTNSAVLPTDVGIYFQGDRIGTTVAVTPGFGSVTTLQTVVTSNNPTNCKLWDQIMAGGVQTNVYNNPGGNAQAIQVIIAGASPGIGSVSSVGLTMPSDFTVSGSPVTGAGTFVVTENTQSANTVHAGPASGSPAAPTYRAIAPADLPLGSSSAFGAVKVDGTTITASAGVISASGSLSNPMTTEGDIIYGGASGTPTRLAAGTSGQVLQTNGSSSPPTWVSGGGGGSSFPLTIVQEDQYATTSAGTSITVTFPQATAASGNTAFILIAFGGNVTPTFPSGWTVDLNVVGTPDARLALLHKATASDTSATFTSSGADGYSVLFFEVVGTHALDASSTGAVAGTFGGKLVMPAITASANSVVFCAICTLITSATFPPSAMPTVSPSWRPIAIAPGSFNGERVLTGHISTVANSGSTTPPVINLPSTTSFFSGGGTAYATFSIL